MQVSIYLDAALVRKVDQKAKKAKKSRSQFVQSILELILFQKKQGTVFDEVFGILSPANAQNLLKTIRESRHNSSRFQ